MTVRRALALAGALALAAPAVMTGAPQDHRHPPAGAPDHHAHRFDDAERYARQFDDPARDAWQMPDRVIEALGIRTGQAVADIGAGTGYFAVRLARLPAAPTVYAVDVEPNMVAHLRTRAAAAKLGNLIPVLGEAAQPKLPRPVDVALVVDTYHHIPDRVAYFRRLAASLTAGGRVAIVDFRKDSPEGPPAHFRFTPEQISAEMAKAGYALQARHDFLPRQHFLVYAPAAAARR